LRHPIDGKRERGLQTPSALYTAPGLAAEEEAREGIMGTGIPAYTAAPVKDFVKAELIVNCLVVLLVLTVVSLRVFSRLSGGILGIDDWFIILAAPLGVGSKYTPQSFRPLQVLPWMR
jgi:hypothetical protein